MQLYLAKRINLSNDAIKNIVNSYNYIELESCRVPAFCVHGYRNTDVGQRPWVSKFIIYLRNINLLSRNCSMSRSNLSRNFAQLTNFTVLAHNCHAFRYFEINNNITRNICFFIVLLMKILHY